MSFDGFMTRAVVHELQSLIGGRITKIHQPFATDLVFSIRSLRKNHIVYFSASPTYSRIHLSEQSYTFPSEPPMFCMFLRKHLEGGIIHSIEQMGLDRIIKIQVKARDEIGDLSLKTMYVEIMGRHSNIILVDGQTNKILESIKHIPASVNRHRTVLPGFPYVLPPAQHKCDPLSVTEEDLLRQLDFNAGKMNQQLVRTMSGMGMQTANEIIHRAHLVNEKTIGNAFFSVIHPLKEHTYTPCIMEKSGKEYFSLFPLTSLDGKEKYFSTVCEMLDRFYYQKGERDRIKQQSHDLERFIKNELDKNEKKRRKLKKTLEKAKDAEQYRRQGELLTAFLHEIKKGQKEIEVIDFYDPEQKKVTIPLNPMRSPADNAQAYFKTYTKMKNSVEIVQQQIKKTTIEIQYFEQLVHQIEVATSKDMEEIREELIEQGYLKRKTKQKKIKKPKAPSIEEYYSSTGVKLLVGKNNKQNDYLTNKLARKNDTWLHTKDIPGSHVIISSEEIDEKTLMEAATLAAYFSKAGQSTNVPVDYTLIRHVKKIPGAKPGFVTYERQQTIYVTPDEDVVIQLKKNAKK